jgi:hypothetical protein
MVTDEPGGERDPFLVSRDRFYADGRNWVPLSELEALTAECEGRGRELEVARECHVEQRQRAEAAEAELKQHAMTSLRMLGMLGAVGEDLTTLEAHVRLLVEERDAITADRDLSYHQGDNISTLYKDLQKRSQDWLRQANERAEAAEATVLTVSARLVDVEAERDEWKLRAEERAEIEEAALHVSQQALDAARERDEALARAQAAERLRDQWGGKTVTAQAEAAAYRHQRVEAIEALSGLLDSLRSAAIDIINGDLPAGDMIGPAKRAEALVELYRRSAPLAPPELVEAYERVQAQMRQDASEAPSAEGQTS